jgi:hypothetical protein
MSEAKRPCKREGRKGASVGGDSTGHRIRAVEGGVREENIGLTKCIPNPRKEPRTLTTKLRGQQWHNNATICQKSK